MPEYTLFERTRIKKDGTEKKTTHLERFRKGIVILKKKMEVPHVVKKNTDERFGSNIKVIKHITANTKKEAEKIYMNGVLADIMKGAKWKKMTS